MDVVRHKTAGKFLERSGEWLERAEAENNLLLGISRYFVTNPSQTDVNPYLLTVEDSGILLGAGLMTPPRHLIISRMPDPALDKFCCLYTDLTNLTSNAIYQRIGYEPVCNSEDLVFE